jgi:hypothetical protein
MIFPPFGLDGANLEMLQGQQIPIKEEHFAD